MDHTQSNSVPTGRASILTFPYIAQSQGDTINGNRWVNSSITHNRFMAMYFANAIYHENHKSTRC